MLQKRQSAVRSALIAAVFLTIAAGSALAADSGVDTLQWDCASPAVRIVYTRNRRPVYPEPKSNGTLYSGANQFPLYVERRDKRGYWAVLLDRKTPEGYLLERDGAVYQGTKENPKKAVLCAGKFTSSGP